MRVRALLLAATLAAGCEETAIVAGAELAIDPPAIDFGPVPTGETRTRDLTLINTSPSAKLELRAIALAEASSTDFAIEAGPQTLALGESTLARVLYTASDAEPDAGHVEITSNALGAPITRVPLSSARTFPKIAVSPEHLDLGSIATGGTASRSLTITNRGDATLEISRVSLRTEGFAGEACARDAECREGRCTTSRTGSICALLCEDTCPAGYQCTLAADGYRACREGDTQTPPNTARGFTVRTDRITLAPKTSTELTVDYAPAQTDRGSAQLVLESNDADRPVVVVALAGRPNDLPPVAAANIAGTAPSPIEPGTRIPLTGDGSYDPEGGAISFEWRFVLRPEGSRARFEAPSQRETAFTVDLPGRYIVHLEARDPGGLTSTNDAGVTVEAAAGTRARIELVWDRPEADLDLHFLSPGAPLGSVGDCYYDNPTPDFPPQGPSGDPVLTASSTESAESIALETPGDGVYTIVVRTIAASPRGASLATVRIFLNDVEAAVLDANLPPASEQWDVATLTWPSGRLTALGTVR